MEESGKFEPIPGNKMFKALHNAEGIIMADGKPKEKEVDK